MPKFHPLSFRVDELLKQKIDAAAKRKNLSSAAFIRQTLERESEQILMDRDNLPDRVILEDIWHRVSMIEGTIKIRHHDNEEHLEELRDYAEKVKSYVRREYEGEEYYE